MSLEAKPYSGQSGHLSAKSMRTCLTPTNSIRIFIVGRLLNVRFYLAIECPLLLDFGKSSVTFDAWTDIESWLRRGWLEGGSGL